MKRPWWWYLYAATVGGYVSLGRWILRLRR